MTEKELLAGSLTRARCTRCGGWGVYCQVVLAYDDSDDLRETEQECPCGCLERPAKLCRQANLPAGRFDGLTLADLDWNAIQPPSAATTIQDYADHLETWLAEGMGLVLSGNVGAGKTHVAVGLVKLACGLGIEAKFVNIADLLSRIKATYDGDGEREAEILDELATVPLLALDDLGVEQPTTWARGRLYTLVNRRWLADRPSVVTTNYGPEMLADRLGERTISRLWGNSLRVRLQGSDYRERIRREKTRRARAQRHLRVIPAVSVSSKGV